MQHYFIDCYIDALLLLVRPKCQVIFDVRNSDLKNGAFYDGELCFRAKRQHLKMFQCLFPQSQGQNLALTVLYVPHSLDSGSRAKPTASALAGLHLSVSHLFVPPWPTFV